MQLVSVQMILQAMLTRIVMKIIMMRITMTTHTQKQRVMMRMLEKSNIGIIAFIDGVSKSITGSKKIIHAIQLIIKKGGL